MLQRKYIFASAKHEKKYSPLSKIDFRNNWTNCYNFPYDITFFQTTNGILAAYLKIMSPIIPSRYGHPKYNIIPQKSRAASLGGFKASQRGTPGTDSKSRRKQRADDNRITVQPNEDEDGDNFFSKHLAAARFQRNHKLINVLFSEVVVDQEPPPDNEKLNACRKRVKSLTDYQKKIDDEMVEMNEKFAAKKAKIIDDSQKFSAKLNEYITKSKKELEVLRAAQEIRRQHEATLRQQTKADSTSSVKVTSQPPSTVTKQASNDHSSSDNRPDSTQDLDKKDKEIPMDISIINEQIQDVRQVLDRLVDLVANRV